MIGSCLISPWCSATPVPSSIAFSAEGLSRYFDGEAEEDGTTQWRITPMPLFHLLQDSTHLIACYNDVFSTSACPVTELFLIRT